MGISISKRNLLKGRLSQHAAFRPPWAINEHLFIEACTRCSECIKHCPRNIIHSGSGGYPELNVSNTGCDFCAACVDVCLPQALSPKTPVPFNHYAIVNQSCFAQQGIVCRSCGEVCEMRAIQFQQVVGGITHVQLDTSSCNGCGECIGLCPANAISLRQRETNQ